MIYAYYYVKCARCKTIGEAFTAPSEIGYRMDFSNHRYWKPTAWEWFEEWLYCNACLRPLREILYKEYKNGR